MVLIKIGFQKVSDTSTQECTAAHASADPFPYGREPVSFPHRYQGLSMG